MDQSNSDNNTVESLADDYPTTIHTISKFIHKWLPLQDQCHVRSNSIANLCPSCHQSMETIAHSLKCPQGDWQNISRYWQDLLFKLHVQNSVDPSYFNVLSRGLYAVRKANAPRIVISRTEPIQQIHQTQELLGWKHLYYGCFAKAWVVFPSSSHATINGVMVLLMCATANLESSTCSMDNLVTYT